MSFICVFLLCFDSVDQLRDLQFQARGLIHYGLKILFLDPLIDVEIPLVGKLASIAQPFVAEMLRSDTGQSLQQYEWDAAMVKVTELFASLSAATPADPATLNAELRILDATVSLAASADDKLFREKVPLCR